MFLVLWKLFLGCLFPFSPGMLLPWLQQLSDRCSQRSGPVLSQICHLWLAICHKVDLAEMCFEFLSRVLSYKKVVVSLFPWFSFSYEDESPEGSHFVFMWSEVSVFMSCLEELQSVMALWAFVKMGHCFLQALAEASMWLKMIFKSSTAEMFAVPWYIKTPSHWETLAAFCHCRRIRVSSDFHMKILVQMCSLV